MWLPQLNWRRAVRRAQAFVSWQGFCAAWAWPSSPICWPFLCWLRFFCCGRRGPGGTCFAPRSLAWLLSLRSYPVLVWQFTPHYFTEILPLALLTYGAFQSPFSEMVLRPDVASFLLFLGIAAYLTWRRGAQQRGDWVWIFAGLGGLPLLSRATERLDLSTSASDDFYINSGSSERSPQFRPRVRDCCAWLLGSCHDQWVGEFCQGSKFASGLSSMSFSPDASHSA